MAPGQGLQADRWDPGCGPSWAWAAPAYRQSLQAALVCHSWSFVPTSNCLHDWAQVVLHLDLGVKLLCHAQPVCPQAATAVRVLPRFQCAGAGGLSRAFQHRLSAFLRELNTKLGGRKLVAAHSIKTHIVVMQVSNSALLQV